MLHLQKILLEKTTLVTCINTIDAVGREEYFYLAVNANKVKLLQAAIAKGNFVPEQHGRILAQGYGQPSKEVMEHMDNTYGCLHEETIKLKVSGNE